MNAAIGSTLSDRAAASNEGRYFPPLSRLNMIAARLRPGATRPLQVRSQWAGSALPRLACDLRRLCVSDWDFEDVPILAGSLQASRLFRLHFLRKDAV
jgi:hypothetical protein